jgi:hypothetical protein
VRIRCDKVVMDNESHVAVGDRQLAHILARMRHDGCGGHQARIDGVSSRPARRIVLRTR